jgi:hypothetical protein
MRHAAPAAGTLSTTAVPVAMTLRVEVLRAPPRCAPSSGKAACMPHRATQQRVAPRERGDGVPAARERQESAPKDGAVCDANGRAVCAPPLRSRHACAVWRLSGLQSARSARNSSACVRAPAQRRERRQTACVCTCASPRLLYASHLRLEAPARGTQLVAPASARPPRQQRACACVTPAPRGANPDQTCAHAAALQAARAAAASGHSTAAAAAATPARPRARSRHAERGLERTQPTCCRRALLECGCALARARSRAAMLARTPRRPGALQLRRAAAQRTRWVERSCCLCALTVQRQLSSRAATCQAQQRC